MQKNEEKRSRGAGSIVACLAVGALLIVAAKQLLNHNTHSTIIKNGFAEPTPLGDWLYANDVASLINEGKVMMEGGQQTFGLHDGKNISLVYCHTNWLTGCETLSVKTPDEPDWQRLRVCADFARRPYVPRSPK